MKTWEADFEVVARGNATWEKKCDYLMKCLEIKEQKISDLTLELKIAKMNQELDSTNILNQLKVLGEIERFLREQQKALPKKKGWFGGQ